MKKLTVSALIALASAGSGLYTFSPTIRLEVERQIRAVSHWSEEARREYPVEFIDHVKVELKADLAELGNSRQALQAEITALAEEHKEQKALLAQARTLAGEFRAAFQRGSFPATIRDAAYTETEVRAQVRSLLAEVAVYEGNVARIEAIRREGQKRTEELVGRIEKTHAELAALGAQRELLRAQKLTEDGAAMLVQVDDLLHGNEQTIEHVNPVRSVRELAAATEKPQVDVNEERVTQFLSASVDNNDFSVAQKSRDRKKRRRDSVDRISEFIN